MRGKTSPPAPWSFAPCSTPLPFLHVVRDLESLKGLTFSPGPVSCWRYPAGVSICSEPQVQWAELRTRRVFRLRGFLFLFLIQTAPLQWWKFNRVRRLPLFSITNRGCTSSLRSLSGIIEVSERPMNWQGNKMWRKFKGRSLSDWHLNINPLPMLEGWATTKY